MPKISVLLTEIQYNQLVVQADAEGLTITDLVLSRLPIYQEKKITLSDVLARVKKMNSAQFSIPTLYEKTEWKNFTKGSKLTVGKQFYKQVNEKKLENIIFLGKSSANLAVYEKK